MKPSVERTASLEDEVRAQMNQAGRDFARALRNGVVFEEADLRELLRMLLEVSRFINVSVPEERIPF